MEINSEADAERARLYLSQYGSYAQIRLLGRTDTTNGSTFLPPLSDERDAEWKVWCFKNWHRPIFLSTRDPNGVARIKLEKEYVEWRRKNKPTRIDKLINFFKKTK